MMWDNPLLSYPAQYVLVIYLHKPPLRNPVTSSTMQNYNCSAGRIHPEANNILALYSCLSF